MTDDARQHLADTAALWSASQVSADDVVTAACDALVADLDSPALRELAGVFHREAPYMVAELLPMALEELDLPFHPFGSRGANAAAAKVMARRCLDGLIRPRAYARWMYRVVGNDSGDGVLEELVLLDACYDMLDQVMQTEGDLDEQVLQACRKLDSTTVPPSKHAPANEVTIGTVGGTYVRISDPEPSPWSSRDGVMVFVIEFHAAGLDSSVAVQVNEGEGQGLGEFLVEVADALHEWSDTKRWVSLEDELTVAVDRHTPGHNTLRFTVQQEDSSACSATLEVAVEAGEEMRRLARDVCQLLRDGRHPTI